MKRLMLLTLGAAALAIAAPHAGARQIVAQSNFVNRQQSPIPQISVTVRADFVLFSLRYSTATRSPDARKDELSYYSMELIEELAEQARCRLARRGHANVVIKNNALLTVSGGQLLVRALHY